MHDLLNKQAKAQKPDASELNRRTREAGLTQTIKVYQTRPNPVPNRGAWIELDPTPKLVVSKGGVLTGVALTGVV